MEPTSGRDDARRLIVRAPNAEDDADDSGSTFDGVRRRRRGGGRRLYTATLGLMMPGSAYLVFHASLASGPLVIRRRMLKHVGEHGAGMCVVRCGYDAGDLIAQTIVAPRLAEILAEVEADPRCRIARGFYVHHAQRVGAGA